MLSLPVKQKTKYLVLVMPHSHKERITVTQQSVQASPGVKEVADPPHISLLKSTHKVLISHQQLHGYWGSGGVMTLSRGLHVVSQ